MELSWSTFLLEIINFLVLVWILKRFLYQPVLDVVSRRQKNIDAQLNEAKQQREQASVLEREFENRLAEWDQERQQLRDKLARDLADERSRQLAELQDKIRAEQEKAEVSDKQRRAEGLHEAELQALRQASGFATRLLREAAGPELEARLVNLLIKELDALPAEQLDRLRTQWGQPPATLEIVSAFTLTAPQRQQLEAALQKVTGLTPEFRYSENNRLLAGLQITVGAWVLKINLQDELNGFAEFAHVTR